MLAASACRTRAMRGTWRNASGNNSQTGKVGSATKSAMCSTRGLGIANDALEPANAATGADQCPVQQLVLAACREHLAHDAKPLSGHHALHRMALAIADKIEPQKMLDHLGAPDLIEIAARRVKSQWQVGDLPGDQIAALGSEYPQRNVSFSMHQVFRIHPAGAA